MRLLTHWFYLLPAAWHLVWHFVAAKYYWKTRASADLQLPPGKNRSARETLRWQHYFYGTTFLSAVFCQLRSRKLSRTEQVHFSRLAALACAFDDSTDALPTPQSPEFARLESPEIFGSSLDDGGHSLHLLKLVCSEIPPARLPAFQSDLQQVFALEVSGRQTLANDISMDELAQYTAEKGGYSVLLFRQLLDEKLGRAERQALFKFGALVQLCDDIFDLWFDRQNHSKTPATVLLEQNNLEQLQAIFEGQLASVAHAFRQISGKQYPCETALRMVHFLASITRVCLRHYAFLQKKHGTLPLDNRHAMVVDMAHWRNRWQAVVALFKL